MRDKRVSLAEAASAVRDGTILAVGGNTLHRAPVAFLHELIRLGVSGLEVVKTAGSYDIDVLCAAGTVRAVAAGYVGYETPFGMAPAYRRAVESGVVEAREHVCASVIAGLRAAAQGVPFMPMAGLRGSDLPAARGFARVANPYGQGDVVVIPAITPDVVVIHAQEADGTGNVRLEGSPFEDVLMAHAGKRVLVTAERIAPALDADGVTIPGFMVDMVIHAPKGASPLSCPGEYDWDESWLASWVAAAKTDEGAMAFIDEWIRSVDAR